MSSDMTDALLAISVSKGADLERLGFADGELERVIRALSIAIVYRGGRIAYGGAPHTFNTVRNEPNYTTRVQQYVGEAYGTAEKRRPTPHRFRHFLAPHFWYDWGAEAVFDYTASISAFSDLVLIDLDGNPQVLFSHSENDGQQATDVEVIGDNGESEKLPVQEIERRLTTLYLRKSDSRLLELTSPSALSGVLDSARIRNAHQWTDDETATGLSAMRRAMAKESRASVLIGGRIEGTQGVLPGIVEEAIAFVDQQRLVLPIASFGGAAQLVALVFGLIDTPITPEDPRNTVSQTIIRHLEARRAPFNKMIRAERIAAEDLRELVFADTPRQISAIVTDLLC